MKKKTKIWLLIGFVIIILISIIGLNYNKIGNIFQFHKTAEFILPLDVEQKTFINEEIIRFHPDQEYMIFFLKKDYNCGDNIEVETNDCIIQTSNGWKNGCSTIKMVKMRC